MTDLNELRPAADALSNRKEILAVEYLQKKRIFGKYSDIDEMASFKSKIKKQKPPPSKEDDKKKEEEKG